MESDPSLGRVGNTLAQDVAEDFNRNKLFRGLACASLGLWSMGVLSAGVLSVGEMSERETMLAYGNTRFTEDELEAYVEEINQRTENYARNQNGPSSSTLEQNPETMIETTTLPPTTTEPPTLAERLIGVELDPRIETAIANMELSVDGYNQFLQSVDTSHVEWSQQFREFNPELIAEDIDQGPSEIFVAHFTVVYANDEPGFGDIMIGNFNLGNLIRSMAGRYELGGKCCGTNWAISRHDTTHQMAPIDAKLNHNPPYDSISTGVEVEADEQASITTKQYEELAYLAIAVLDTQGRLGNFPLQDIFKGHGEMRDHWNHHHPDQKYGVRDDFDAPVMQFLRHFVQQFLDENPGIVGSQPFANLR